MGIVNPHAPLPFSRMALSLALLFCAAAEAQDKPGDTETVIATYRVKPGREAEFQKTLAQDWAACSRLGLVLDEPHLVLRGAGESGKTYFVEILTWKSHDAPDHAPAEVRAIWQQLEALCEAREGHRGIEFPEVKIVSGGKS